MATILSEFSFAAARAAMVESQLKPQGVTDAAILDAMGTVAREEYVADDAKPFAYCDRAVPSGAGRFLAAPGALGQLLSALAPVAGERALVVGAGSGYSAALLGALGLAVSALENDPALARRNPDGGGSAKSVDGPLERGNADGRPYDLILIDGAVPSIPDALIEEIGDGGRLGAAIIDRGITRLILGHKSGTAFGYRTLGDAGFPPLPGFAVPAEFQF